MSELERKHLIINNRYQHLVSTYLVPDMVPCAFPGFASFNLPNTSRQQAPYGGCREVAGHFPNCAEWYVVAKIHWLVLGK